MPLGGVTWRTVHSESMSEILLLMFLRIISRQTNENNNNNDIDQDLETDIQYIPSKCSNLDCRCIFAWLSSVRWYNRNCTISFLTRLVYSCLISARRVALHCVASRLVLFSLLWYQIKKKQTWRWFSFLTVTATVFIFFFWRCRGRASSNRRSVSRGSVATAAFCRASTDALPLYNQDSK